MAYKTAAEVSDELRVAGFKVTGYGRSVDVVVSTPESEGEEAHRHEVERMRRIAGMPLYSSNQYYYGDIVTEARYVFHES